MSVKSSHNTLIQKITDLEKRIKKLQKFETAFQASNDAMALQDVDGKFIEVNAAFCTVMGYSREELLQMQAIDLKPSALHTVFKQEQNELKELGNIFLETVCLRKDGSPIPCELSGSVVQPANETLIHLVVRDITQRKLQEDTLRRYEKIFSLSQDLIAYVDVDYIYRMINEQFCHDHGKTREEIIGRTIAEVCGEGLFTQTVKMQLDRCLSGEIAG
jgi:PAS domain S-box-containing protein